MYQFCVIKLVHGGVNNYYLETLNDSLSLDGKKFNPYAPLVRADTFGSKKEARERLSLYFSLRPDSTFFFEIVKIYAMSLP